MADSAAIHASPGAQEPDRRRAGSERIIGVIQELSMARDLARIQEIVRHAARELTGADEANFVLRDGDQCFYADEDAIEPLWKGRRFPMSACISGWSMLNKKPAVIEDNFADPRIPGLGWRWSAIGVSPRRANRASRPGHVCRPRRERT